MLLKIGIILLINSLVRSEDNLVQISLKKVNNIIDDRFISYTLDSTFLQKQISISEQSVKLTKTLSPAYVKFHEKTLLDFIIENATSSNSIFESKRNNWESLVNWFRNNDLIPVIVLDYHSQTWEPKNVLSYLNLVDKWNLNECVWQLGGDDFNNTNIRKYVNDIKILKTMINTFPNRKHSWKIVASKMNSPNDNFDEMKLFYDLVPSTVAAISWLQNDLYTNIMYSENNLLERDSLVRFFSRASIPTWLTLKPSKSVDIKDTKSICDQACILDGLTWAINLGENSKHGFDVIFKPITEQTHISTNLEYYITKLYKNMIGRKVFDVKLLSGDRGVNFYSYCTRNMSGSITMLAINTADEQMKITTKIGFRSAGNEIMQYILTTSEGNILLNNEKLTQDTLIDPFIKYKRLHRPLVLSLPPYSVGFFIFPKAGIFECMEDDYEDIDIEEKLSEASHKPNNILSKIKASTTDRLLEQLIKENLKKDIGNSKSEILKPRVKRSLTPNKTNLKKNQKITKRQMNRLKRYIVGKKLNLFPYKLSKNGFARKFKKPLLKTLTRKRRQLESKRPEMFPKLKMLTKTGLNKNIRSPITFPPKQGTIMNHPKLIESEGPEIIFKHSENLNLPDRDVFFKIKDKGESSDSEQEIENDKVESLEDKNEEKLKPAVDDITSLDTELEELKHYARHELPEEIIQFLLSKKNKDSKPGKSDAVDINDSVEELNIYGSLMDEIHTSDANTAHEDTNVNDDDEQQMESQHQFYVLKELEPTAKQNLENLLKARINLKTFYIDQSKNDSREYDSEAVLPVLAEEEDDINDDGFFSVEDDAGEKKEANKISGQTAVPKNNSSSTNLDFDTIYVADDIQIANTTVVSSSADSSHNQLIEGLYQLIDLLGTETINQRKELAQDKTLTKRAATYKNEDKRKKKIQNNMKPKFMYDTSLEDNDRVLPNVYVVRSSNHIVRKNPSKTILGLENREGEENKSSDELTKVMDKTEDDEIITNSVSSFNTEISRELDNVSNLSHADASTRSNSLQEEEDVDKELVQNVIKLLSRSFDKCIISLHDTVSSWFNYFQT